MGALPCCCQSIRAAAALQPLHADRRPPLARVRRASAATVPAAAAALPPNTHCSRSGRRRRGRTWMQPSQLRSATSRGMPNSMALSMNAPGVTYRKSPQTFKLSAARARASGGGGGKVRAAQAAAPAARSHSPRCAPEEGGGITDGAQPLAPHAPGRAGRGTLLLGPVLFPFPPPPAAPRTMVPVEHVHAAALLLRLAVQFNQQLDDAWGYVYSGRNAQQREAKQASQEACGTRLQRKRAASRRGGAAAGVRRQTAERHAASAPSLPRPLLCAHGPRVCCNQQFLHLHHSHTAT